MTRTERINAAPTVADLLDQMHAHLTAVTAYGLHEITDDIDREHIIVAQAICAALVKAQRDTRQ